MMALFEMSKTAGNAPQATSAIDYDWLFWLIIVAVALVIGAIASLGFSNWRAKQAIKRARADWAAIHSRHLVIHEAPKPNPLRGK